MTEQLDRREALSVLRLPPSADTAAVKRAYRKLARDHHPDVGGDTARFHELQLAYELLLGVEASPAPVRPAGRPSRPPRAWDATRDDRRDAVDIDLVDWDVSVPSGEVSLSRDDLALRLRSDGQSTAPVLPVVATSRAPGSKLNRAAARLSPDLTAHLRILPATDDRGHVVVATSITAATRRARRALDTIALDGGWMRTRGSASTTLRATATPDADPRSTALRATLHAEQLLERLGWPLAAWTATQNLRA